ncbi:diguanylate cyclase [Streptomyces sp. NPDC048376]|uniref:diguanylate cyclase domain-containing protein n=1 Tax=unclassified Streptomyces TaxID=2593676 RepID=UPI00069B0034
MAATTCSNRRPHTRSRSPNASSSHHRTRQREHLHRRTAHPTRVQPRTRQARPLPLRPPQLSRQWPHREPFQHVPVADIAALRDQIQQPLHHDGHTLDLAVSIGIARATDLPGEPADRLLRGADTAMYKVKKGHARFPYLATVSDAYTPSVNGRRAGRPGAHLPLA